MKEQGGARPTPLCNVEEHRSAEGGSVWFATNRDPQFLLANEHRDYRFASGWYRVTIETRVVQGALIAPCLYPDYGNGMSESDRIMLGAPDEHGRIQTVICLWRDAGMLRFDPSIEKVALEFGWVSVARLSRAAALREMLAAIDGVPHDSFRALRATIRAAFSSLRARSLSRLGSETYAAYVSRIKSTFEGYERWVAAFDRPLDGDTQRERIEALSRRPLISILMPTYETPEKWLRKAIDSVIRQVYPYWELCIADDASRSPHVRRVLKEYEARDPRIHVVFRTLNGHISEASNSALEIATGEFVALLDHDDELHHCALLEVARAVTEHPNVQVVYSDEDKLDEYGRRFDPYFKSDWNYDLFLGQNCISHLGVYATSLVKEVGGFRKGLEGSQDWDLALRCIERLKPQQIYHIPKILYHWRAIAGSTALAVNEKSYTVMAAAKAVREHLERVGTSAEVVPLSDGYLAVRRFPPEIRPKVSLVIPTRDKVELLSLCVDSILTRSTYENYEILIVDNDSREQATLDYFEHIQSDTRVRVIRYEKPFNYSSINNFAVGQSDGEIVGLINNDIEVIAPNWLEEMVAHAIRPEVGAVGAMLYYPDDTIQHAGVLLGFSGVAGHMYAGCPRGHAGYMGRARISQQLSAVTAACLLVKRSVFDAVGGLDERLAVAFNDVDFGLRIRAAGYVNIWTPHAELYHHESASRGLEDTPEKQQRFRGEVALMRARWSHELESDPAYNPNLSLQGTPFELAIPPR